MDSNQYPDEEQYLAETVKFIDDEVRRLKSAPPATAAYKEAAREIQRVRDELRTRFQRMRSVPYLRRVDFLKEGHDKPIKGYIGVGSIPNRVFDWTSPFATQLGSADPRLVHSYQALGDEIRGRITLKRYFMIEDAQLESVTEAYRSLPSADGVSIIQDSSESFMVEQLSRSRGGQLKQTVSTLQQEQYKQIAEAPGQVMLVQGVAGSGKSIVGLHRIAYLLSPFNERPERVTASRVVFFGPTRTFLNYVANLLPSLGVRQVSQRTVRDWLRSTLSERVYLDRGEPLIENLLRHKGKK